ncbi:membrane protein [Mycobacterium sp. SWH-M1]|nr:membrane protein [Mycobacterium sp. SWH-M1]
MHAGSAVAVAASFIWLGMVLAISFLEAPLKFQAPGVTLPIGLGIGRLVFRALNACEAVLAVVVLAGGFAAQKSGVAGAAMWVFVLAVVVLAVQVLLVRPALTRRSDRVLAGEDGPRSRAHLAYVGLEVAKVIALAVGGVLVLAG